MSRQAFGPNVSLLPPLEYLSLVQLLKRCHFVMTDSGGLQEEAPPLGKPVLVLRDSTERPEAVEAGTARLVGTDRETVRGAALELLRDEHSYRRMAHAGNPYGDGRAAPRTVEALLRSDAQLEAQPEPVGEQRSIPSPSLADPSRLPRLGRPGAPDPSSPGILRFSLGTKS
jgi:UDP-N-acetylglucosamine 2-epimerase